MLGVVRRASSIALATALAVAATLGIPSMAAASGTSTISGTVFQDLNRNGVQDPGEAGFANVFLYLYSGSGTVVTTAYTDTNGHFQFGTLADGSYRVAVAPGFWPTLEKNWVVTSHPAPAPGYLDPAVSVSLSGSATADIALRPIARSTTPVTSVATAGGTVINSFDDVVPATDVSNALTHGTLLGAEQPLTTINFDYGASYTVVGVSGAPGSYANYQATVDLRYTDWVDQFDLPLFYEYGHAWSEYYMYIVQQDPGLTSYLRARGLNGNPAIGSNLLWDPTELIADDYRQLFGSANAESYAQNNTAIPAASQVFGLKDFLQSSFTQAPYRQPAPSITAASPGEGLAGGGTSVTINGSNFTGSGWAVSGLSFGGVPASSYTVLSPTQITGIAPAGSGVVDILVRTMATSNGYVETSPATTADQFSYVPVPTVAGISPAKGPMKGGTSVTITGTGFSGPSFTATSVYFGSLAAGFSVLSPTTIVATSPASRTLQSVVVTVATPGGATTGGTSSGFTYVRK